MACASYQTEYRSTLETAGFLLISKTTVVTSALFMVLVSENVASGPKLSFLLFYNISLPMFSFLIY